MGGGGFMQHALNTNRKDRAQRAARRKKFKGDNNEQLLQSGTNRKSLNFPEIPVEEVALVRKRIEIKHQKNRKRNVIIIACTIAFVIATIIIIYSKTDGFEYW